MNTQYETITGRHLRTDRITASEKEFLVDVLARYKGQPSWSDFASWWPMKLNEAGLKPDSVTYRICQDLEARLGIAQKKVAMPDYRDYLSDLVEERYGSRYQFCKATGIDQGQLSRVFASRSDLSLKALQEILESLDASLVIQRTDRVSESTSPEDKLIMPAVGTTPGKPPSHAGGVDEKKKRGGGGDGRDPLLQGLINNLPAEGAAWSAEDRLSWLELARGIFDFVYGKTDPITIQAPAKE